MKRHLLILLIILFFLVLYKRKEVSQFIEEKITGFNNKFDDIFQRVGKSLNISPKILKAISANESSVGLDKRVEKIGNTQGIMHVIYDTAKRFNPDLKPEEHKNFTPEKDIETGSKYFSFLFGKYKNLDHAVMAYNGGEGRMNQILMYKKTGKFRPIRTQDNLEKMLKAEKNMNEYLARFKRNYGKLGVV